MADKDKKRDVHSSNAPDVTDQSALSEEDRDFEDTLEEGQTVNQRRMRAVYEESERLADQKTDWHASNAPNLTDEPKEGHRRESAQDTLEDAQDTMEDKLKGVVDGSKRQAQDDDDKELPSNAPNITR